MPRKYDSFLQKIKALPEDRSTLHALGQKDAEKETDDHGVIRRIIMAYISTTPLWIKGLLSISLLAIAIDRSEGYQLTVVLVVFSIVLEASYGKFTLNIAQIIWASLERTYPLEEPELLTILANFVPYFYLNRAISFLIFLVRLATVAILMVKGPFWYGISLFATGVLATDSIPFQIKLKRIARFAKATIEDRETLLNEYSSFWKDNTVEDPLPTNGILIALLFLIYLYILKIVNPKSIFFISYFSLILTGCLLQILYSRSIRFDILKKSVFRKPASPWLSRILSLHLLHSLMFDWTFSLVSIVATISVSGKQSIFLTIIEFAPIVYINRFILCNGTIKLFKRMLDRDFNIVIFRRFSAEHSHTSKAVIYPAFGAYGQILSLQDETLMKAKEGVSPDSESILSEYYTLASTTEEKWRQNISKYLSIADFCILYWPDMPTFNMQWEFAEAIRMLPAQRILLIVKEEQLEEILIWILGSEHDPDQLKGLQWLPMPNKAVYPMILPVAYKIMKDLKTIPR